MHTAFPFHSCVFLYAVFLPGKPPWTEEPGGLQYMGSQSHDLATEYTHIHLYECQIVK